MRTGVPCNENRVFPVRIYYTGKTLFWPCNGPVRDCSVAERITFALIKKVHFSRIPKVSRGILMSPAYGNVVLQKHNIG